MMAGMRAGMMAGEAGVGITAGMAGRDGIATAGARVGTGGRLFALTPMVRPSFTLRRRRIIRRRLMGMFTGDRVGWRGGPR